jgi:hypothetical protein
MRVEVIKRFVPGIGVRGQQKDIDNRSARALVMLGKVKRVEELRSAVADTAKKATTRTYKRRDMQAEQPAAEVVSVSSEARQALLEAPVLEEVTDVFAAIDEPTEEAPQ